MTRATSPPSGPQRAGAVLLLGSATPRPESIHRMRCSVLSERVDGRPMPDVQVLDMRGSGHGLHPVTSQALADVRSERAKAIVLLNRRGWSNFLSCRSCGRVWRCPDCDVALVLHRAGGYVACHHCGHREPAPSSCPDCASTSVARHGAGTERLAHELTRRSSTTAPSPSSGSTPTRSPAPARRPTEDGRRGGGAAAALRGGPVRGADRHADGRQGPRLPRRAPRGRARRGQHAALSRTSGPRSGRSP